MTSEYYNQRQRPTKEYTAFVIGDERSDSTGLSTKLYLYNLLTSEVKNILSISDNQTFNAGTGYPSIQVGLRWRDDLTVEANIYEQDGVEKDVLGFKLFIEEKIIPIQ